MSKFIRDIVIFCSINLLVLGYLYWIYDVPGDYLASVNDKLDRLATKAPPRLIFIGGSSVAWSNDSQLAKDTFGIEAENYAIHAGMGLNMRLEEARQLPKPGDTVVISIEWAVFKDDPWTRKMAECAIACPRIMRFMNVRDLKLVADGMLPALKMPFVAFFDDFKKNRMAAFTHASAQKRKQWRLRANFNELGDFVGHHPAKPPGIGGKTVSFSTDEQLIEGIELLNELNRELNERGVKMYYFIPIIAQSRYEQFKETADSHVAILKENLEIPILNPDTYAFPDDSYFDSCYHMQDEPGTQRTQILVDGLKPYLQTQ